MLKYTYHKNSHSIQWPLVEQLLQEHVFPMAYIILCVRFTYIVHLVTNTSLIGISPIPDSAISTTLGWLNLA
jgi:hypothetical protein